MDDDTTENDTPHLTPPHLTVIDGGGTGEARQGETAGQGEAEQAKPKPKAKRRKLTAKQERFLAALIRDDGRSLSDCYREAYDTSRMSNAAIHNEASLLAGHHEVARRLTLNRASIERSAQSSALARRRFVLEGLEREATDAASDSARVAALVALGRTTDVGLFLDRVDMQVADQSPQEVRDQLEARLAALLGRTG